MSNLVKLHNPIGGGTSRSSKEVYYFNPYLGIVTAHPTQQRSFANLPNDVGLLVDANGAKYHRTGEGPGFQKETHFVYSIQLIDLTHDTVDKIILKNGITINY